MTNARIVAGLTMTSLLLGASCRACHHDEPSGTSDAVSDAGDAGTGAGTTLEIKNDSDAGVQVYVAFGSRSIITPTAPGWEFCQQEKSYPMVCDFNLGAAAARELPLAGVYFNATLSFGGTVTCGTTKAEFDVNSTTWYDTMDLSLVDGFNAALAIELREPGVNPDAGDAGPVLLGPVLHGWGNERALGVYPLACDICVARQGPPCGYKPGPSPECKKGKQSDPDVPCQYQGSVMHGANTAVKLTYLGMLGKEVLHLGKQEEIP